MANSETAHEISSALQGVDLFTGKFCSLIEIANLIGNNGLGPTLKLKRHYNHDKNNRSLEKWPFNFNYVKLRPRNEALKMASDGRIFLENGQSWRWDGNSTISLPTTVISIDSNSDQVTLLHSNGNFEILSRFSTTSLSPGANLSTYNYYLPTKLISPSGHEISLQWNAIQRIEGHTKFNVPHLKSISDESKILLSATHISSDNDEYTERLNIWPDTEYSHTCIMNFKGLLLTKIEHSNAPDKTEFEYTPSAIIKIKHSSGITETVNYQRGKVSSHVITDSNTKTLKNRQYSYKSAKGKTVTSIIEGNKTTHYTFAENRLPISESVWVDGYIVKDTQLSRVSKSGNTVLTGAAHEPTADRLESTTTTTYYSPDLTTRSEIVTVTLDTLGNVIARTENGITTEWTYYRGMLEEDKLIRTEKVYANTTALSVVAGIGDYTNPIGWGFLLFGKAGLTWGTRELRQKFTSPYITPNSKTLFNLPVSIGCPGDPNQFKVHVESEKVYTLSNGQRSELQWTFYSYDSLPVKGSRVKGPTLKPSKKLTIYNPAGDANGKLLLWERSKIVLEENTYDTNTGSSDHGRLLSSTQSILIDADGNTAPGSVVRTTLNYTLKDDRLTVNTTVTAENAPKITMTQVTQTHTGLLLEQVDAQDNRTTYQYDTQGRITQKTDYADEPDLKGTTTFTYVETDGETQVTRISPLGEQSKDVFDMLGRPIRNEWLHTDGSWLKLYEITFDAQGRETSTTQYDYTANKTLLPLQTREFTYDRWDGISEIKWAVSGETENFSYDPVNRITSAWLGQGNETGGRTMQIIDEPGGGERHETYLHANGKFVSSQTHRYDALGRLITESSSYASTIHRTYDAFGRISSLETAGITTINDFPAHTQAPVAISARLKSDAKNISLGTQTVDGLGRVTATAIGGTTVKYNYIGSGNWGKADTQPGATSASSIRIELNSTWDATTRTITETTKGGVTRGSSTTTSKASFEYSIQGLLLKTVDAFGNSTRYSYDVQGRLLNSESATLNIQFQYGPLGRLDAEIMKDLVNGKTMTTAYTYNNSGQETQREFTATGFPRLILKTTYTTHLIAEMELLQDALTLKKEQYLYNSKGQLETYYCSGPHKPVTPDNYTIDRQTFMYDMAGNLTQCTLTSNGNTFIDSYAYGSADPCQALSITRRRGTTQHITSYKYDSLGYLIDKDGVKFHYNMQGQLIGHNDPQQDAEYCYDTVGRIAGCTGKRFYEQFYYQDDFQYARKGVFGPSDALSYRTSILMNQSSSCLLLQQTINQGGSSTATASRSFEVKDIKGSVIASYDLTTNQVNFFNYTPFGYRPHTLDQRSWVGFNGQPMDSVTGNYPLGNGARVYNPAKQSFDAADPISPFGAGGSNRYSYCSNDPVNKSDPTGFTETLNQYSIVAHAPAIEDPLVAAAVLGGIGLALAPFTGGASIGWTVAAVGLAAVSAGFGIASAVLRESDPELSEVLGWAALGTGLAEVGVGIGTAVSAARIGTKGAARETSLVYQHNRLAKGNMAVESLTVRTRSIGFQNGRASYEIYSGGPTASKAYIYSHGVSRADKFRFSLRPGLDLHFFAPKGASIATDNSRLLQHLSGKLHSTTYMSKAHNSLNPTLVPDYVLSEFKAKDMVINGILKTKQDLDKVMKDLAAAHSIDIIRPKGQIPLSELITALQLQNYKKIYGSFCRGPIRDFVGLAEIKRIRHSKWRMFVLDMEGSLVNSL